MAKEIIRVQLAAFFDNEYSGKHDKIMTKIVDILGESQSTQLFPIPVEAPGEIPRLMLFYKDYQINVSKNRADLFSSDLKKNKTDFEKILQIIKAQARISYKRVGYVKNLFIDKSIDYFKEAISVESIKRRTLTEATVRVNFTTTVDGYDCNNSEDVSYGFIEKKEDENKTRKLSGLIITKDINTLPEDDYTFDEKDVISLAVKFDEISEEIMLVGE